MHYSFHEWNGRLTWEAPSYRSDSCSFFEASLARCRYYFRKKTIRSYVFTKAIHIA